MCRIRRKSFGLGLRMNGRKAEEEGDAVFNGNKRLKLVLRNSKMPR